MIMIAPNTQVFTVYSESSTHGSYPSDKEIALLTFETWKMEGCPQLRPDHWLKAEKKLVEAYAGHGGIFAPLDSDGLEDFWERETETISGFAQVNELNLATKGWS
ncbi:MAG TPA: hypothetical protein VGE29_04820 [Prosthecobacter sp.]